MRVRDNACFVNNTDVCGGGGEEGQTQVHFNKAVASLRERVLLEFIETRENVRWYCAREASSALIVLNIALPHLLCGN